MGSESGRGLKLIKAGHVRGSARLLQAVYREDNGARLESGRGGGSCGRWAGWHVIVPSDSAASPFSRWLDGSTHISINEYSEYVHGRLFGKETYISTYCR